MSDQNYNVWDELDKVIDEVGTTVELGEMLYGKPPTPKEEPNERDISD